MIDSFKIKKKNLIYIWSVIYLIVIYTCTILFDSDFFLLYFLYFTLAIPFIKHIDKYALLCFVLSNIAYFFLGADEAVWSIYSILVILGFMNLIINRKINKINIIPFLLLIVAVYFSYIFSDFEYITGAYAMIYNFVISIFLAFILNFNDDTLSDFLPMISTVQIVAFIFFVIMNGYFDGYGLSISQSVNHNSFGTAISILSIIIFVKVLISKNIVNFYFFIWIITLILLVLSGSRNALLGLVLSMIIIYIFIEKQNGKVITVFPKLILLFSFIFFILFMILPENGFSINRYDYISLISNGGSNRTTIWRELTPIIWEKYKWFGYGPSHFTSTQIMTPIVNRVYAHTHNTIFESWGELGFLGLIPFLWLLVSAYKSCIKLVKQSENNIFLMALFVLIMFIGLGESLFQNISLWLLISYILSGSGKRVKIG